MKPLVILRPEPAASATFDRAREAGLEPVKIPLFAVGPIDWKAPPAEEFDALLLTSANAIRHGGRELDSLKALPTCCVGEATALAAAEAGFPVTAVGSGDGAAAVLMMPEGTRLLHLAGRDHRGVAKAAIPVYASALIDPPPSLDALPGSVAMIHSPRAGARLAELVADRSDVMIAAISDAAAAACGEGWRAVAVAETPDDHALLVTAMALCHTGDR